MTVSARARWVGGILAGDGSLRSDISVDDAVAALERLVTPATVWCTTRPADEGWEAFDLALDAPPATWVTPDDATVEACASVLDEAWSHVDRLLHRPIYIEPVLRVKTHSPADAAAVRSLGSVEGIAVSSFDPNGFGRWTWRWPLRVGVVAQDAAEVVRTLEGDGSYREHYEVRQVFPGQADPVDLLIVDGRMADVIRDGDFGAVGVAIVTSPSRAPSDEQMRSVVRAVRPGAVVSLFDEHLEWFEEFVRELSHDRPIDAALCLAQPNSLLIGDPDFIMATSVRNWARRVSDDALDRGDVALADRLRSVIFDLAFERESGGAREIGAAVRDAEAGGSGQPLEISGVVEVRTASRPPETSAPPEETDDVEVDDRRLIAEVSDARGEKLSHGFVAGRVHRLRLRVAADAAAGETGASEPLRSPQPGETVELRVVVHVEGSKKRLAPVTLVYPAVGDGDWIEEPISFTAPRRTGELTLFITVQWEGRVIQSARLTGPLHQPSDAAGRQPGEFRLDVDRSSSGGGSEHSSAADATLVQVPGTSDAPMVLDADSVVPVDPAVLTSANKQVRKSLINSFNNPASSLEDAASVLADLAVRGTQLRRALIGKRDEFFDDASWIHVMSFGGSPVPYELIYTHAMPRTKPIEVCGPALAGASGCASDCAERDRDDRVCPFGFWGTSKVVERRMHSGGRNDSTAGARRVVRLQAGAVSAVTDLANAEDPTATDRIARAIEDFAEHGTAAHVTTWSELEGAVADQRQLVCLVTHTIEPDDPDDDLAVELQLGGDTERLHLVDERYVNPSIRRPGPVVLALGCDTATISASFATFVSGLHSLGAEIVVSAASQIPGKEAADFVVRFTTALGEQLRGPGEHRFGAVMTEVRKQTLLSGDLLAFALTVSGDGDVQLAGRS